MTAARTINLPADLCTQADSKLGPKFGGLEPLLEYVLRYLLEDKAQAMDEAEQNLVEQRLRELGYL